MINMIRWSPTMRIVYAAAQIAAPDVTVDELVTATGRSRSAVSAARRRLTALGLLEPPLRRRECMDMRLLERLREEKRKKGYLPYRQAKRDADKIKAQAARRGLTLLGDPLWHDAMSPKHACDLMRRQQRDIIRRRRRALALGE